MDARADHIAALTQVEDLPLSPRVVLPVFGCDLVWRPVAWCADVDAGQDQDGGGYVGEKGFRHYAKVRS